MDKTPKATQTLPTSTDMNTLKLTSALLRAELLKPYTRKVWEPFVHHEKLNESSPFSIRAIARAISAHQQVTYGLDLAPDHYKDRVSRALSGEVISCDTLDLFCETFDFSLKTIQALSQAKSQGADSSKGLQFLRAAPQSLISNAFIDISLPPAGSSELELKASITYLSLESGCFALVLNFPHSTQLECISKNFSVAPSLIDGEWVLTALSFIEPLQAFSVRLKVKIKTQITEDGSSLIELPFPGRNYSTGVRVIADEPPLNIWFEEGPDQNQAPSSRKGEIANPAASHFYPLLQQRSVSIRWAAQESPS